MKNKTSKSAIWSVCTGWAVPLVGLILGIVAVSNAQNDNSRTLGIVGIVEAIIAWIFWAAVLM